MKKTDLLNDLYTSRWYLSNIIGEFENNSEISFEKVKSTLNEGNSFLNDLVSKINNQNTFEDTVHTEPEHKLFYPEATIVANIKLKSRGKYEDSYPRGAVIHYTSGRYEKGKQSALDTLAWAKDQGYTFMIIAYDGTVLQSTPLDEWGYHAGESNWAGLGASVSNKLVGIEISNAGLLEKRNGKYYSWFNTEIPQDQVREVVAANDNQVKGYFHKYSEAQEKSLINLLVWLKNNNPEIFDTKFILGHDEVAGPKGIGYSRKQDPGGALSMTMTNLRKLIKERTE